ncbi:MAG: calcium-binding protein [Cyanobacteriota bacterium]|nr:calcium-binding protein [Cyanobacteriota bacterium]
MTTTTFDTAVNELVNDFLNISTNDVLTTYTTLTSIDGKGFIEDLVDSDEQTILDELESAGVDNAAVDAIEANLDSYIDNILSNLQFNINGDNNNLTGGSSSDNLVNVDNADSTLIGNEGNDLVLNIGSGNNDLQGNDGDDLIGNLGTGNSILSGGVGDDMILNMGTGNNVLDGGNGDDTIVNAGTGSNTFAGGNGNDTLINFGGAAQLSGDNGSDILIGGNSNDTLVGGNSDDTLTGGGGADTFELSAEYSLNISWRNLGFFRIPSISFDWTTSGIDTITDFDASEDIIKIDIADSFNIATTDLDFNSSTGELSLDNNVIAILDGVTDFNVDSVQIV